MEKIIESVSPFGKFQKLVLILIGFASSLTAMVVFSSVFTAARPKFSCYRIDDTNQTITENEFDTCALWSQIQSNQTVRHIKSWFKLVERRTTKNIEIKTDCGCSQMQLRLKALRSDNSHRMAPHMWAQLLRQPHSDHLYVRLVLVAVHRLS